MSSCHLCLLFFNTTFIQNTRNCMSHSSDCTFCHKVITGQWCHKTPSDLFSAQLPVNHIIERVHPDSENVSYCRSSAVFSLCVSAAHTETTRLTPRQTNPLYCVSRARPCLLEPFKPFLVGQLIIIISLWNPVIKIYTESHKI